MPPVDAGILVRGFEADRYGHGWSPLFHDAVVLASALAVRRLEPQVGFLAWDADLTAAAAREGFAQPAT